jgi:putative flippase GtrA
MITFGYNGRFSSPIRALLFVALGVLMIVAKADAMHMVVKIFAAGVVMIWNFLCQKSFIFVRGGCHEY